MSGATITVPPSPSARHELRNAGASFVATKTATVRNEDGKDETIKAGTTWVYGARHFLVVTYPYLFERRGTRAARSAPQRPRRSTPARPARPASPTWKPLVRLSPDPSGFTVRLSENAYQAMGDEAFGQRHRNIETGGALFGEPAKDSDQRVRVKRAGGPGPKARSGESWMHADTDHYRREAIELHRSGSPLRWIGDWHTHPTVDSGWPSENDLRFFAWNCRELHHMGRSMNHYIGLILTPVRSQDRFTFEHTASWARPTITAWHMQAVGEDQFICAPAEVVRC